MSVAEKTNESITELTPGVHVGGERALILGAGVAPRPQDHGFAESG